MPLTYLWTISRLDCIPQSEQGADYVVAAYWSCTATDGTYTGSLGGVVTLQPDPSAPFIPYADLTESVVLDWCFAQGVNKDGIEDAVAQQIAAQINPPIVSPPLPWASSPSED